MKRSCMRRKFSALRDNEETLPNGRRRVANPLDRSTTVVMTSSQTVIANFASCACATDVTASIAITYGGITFNPTTRQSVQRLMLTNKSTSTITGPISFVLDQLPSGVTLYNPSGTTDLMLPSGSPYMNVNINLPAGQSITMQPQFTNPGNVPIAYRARVLAGEQDIGGFRLRADAQRLQHRPILQCPELTDRQPDGRSDPLR